MPPAPQPGRRSRGSRPAAFSWLVPLGRCYRAGVRQEEIASAKRRFGDDPANAQALRDALADIDSRYKALSELDDRSIENARKALEAWDRTR